MEKHCPLSMASEHGSVLCYREFCEWWNVEDEECLMWFLRWLEPTEDTE